MMSRRSALVLSGISLTTVCALEKKKEKINLQITRGLVNLPYISYNQCRT